MQHAGPFVNPITVAPGFPLILLEQDQSVNCLKHVLKLNQILFLYLVNWIAVSSEYTNKVQFRVFKKKQVPAG